MNPGFWMLDFCRSWTWDIVKDLNMMEHDGTYTLENWWINFNKVARR